jgi:hypothetical protein
MNGAYYLDIAPARVGNGKIFTHSSSLLCIISSLLITSFSVVYFRRSEVIRERLLALRA